MLKLLFDLSATQPNASGKRHGGGIYGEIVFKRILELGYRPICYYSASKWLNPEIMSLVQFHALSLYDIDTTALDIIVEDNHIERIYSPLPQHREACFTKCKVLGTIHGLRDIELPWDSFFWKYKSNLQLKNIAKWFLQRILHCKKWERGYKDLDKNDKFEFVTVSHHSAMAFKSYFPNFKDKDIKVFYSPSTTASNSTISKKNFNTNYFLMVSGNRWEKNNLRAIMALDRLFSFGYCKGFNAIVTGVDSSNFYRYKIKNAERFKFVGYVGDRELEQLYNEAFAFIYPTLNEGFGYPPLEAMRCGIPVLTSPFSSIPEICGGSVLYFNPFSVEEIMNRILLILDDKIYKVYSELSRERYRYVTDKQNDDLDRLINYIYSLD